MKLSDRARAALWRVPVGLQLSALYTVLLVVTLAALGGALYSQLDGFLVQNTAARLQQAAQAVVGREDFGRGAPDGRPGTPRGSGPPTSGFYGATQDPTTALLIRALSAPDVTVAVLDAQGNVISATTAVSGSGLRALPTLPTGWQAQVAAPPDAAGTPGAASQWIVAAPGGGRELAVAQRLDMSAQTGDPQDRLLLLQAASLDAADAILGQVRLYLALGLLIGVLVGVPAGLFLTRAVLRPLDRMARTAEAIAAGDLDRRLRLPPGGNEVARLGGAFDHMVDRLAATLQAQRRFIGDASHELRTPLTSLEGLSEMLLLGADRGDSQAIQRVARSMHGELRRMARLVTELLALSRLDNAAPLTLVPVDAGKLLDDVAEQMAPVAAGREIRLIVAHDGPVLARAEPDRLKQVLLNLVDNALRYTPPAGEIRLTAGREPAAGLVRIVVQDSGPGIAPEHLPHIFDRFYRADASRARTSGNTGLGLAIVRSIVAAHGGTITVESPPGAGACFTVTLPAERAGASPPAAAPTPREPQAVAPL